MKWFTHDNDLHNWPPMQGIIADLGWAGYGRALAVLETLAKYVANDGKSNFILPLAKPMDITYWARELGQSVEDTERMFDVFQSVALIQPWRETKAICAPMLGDRVDEWTKRKQKARGKGGPGSKKLPKSKKAKELPAPQPPLLPEHFTESSEIIAEYSDRHEVCAGKGCKLNATEPHRKAAVRFYQKHGRDVALAAWVLYLWNSDDSVPGDEGAGRTWRLKDFIDSGDAELWAAKVRPFIERGVTSFPAMDVLRKVTYDFTKEFDELISLNPNLVDLALKVLNGFSNGFVEHIKLGHELTRFQQQAVPKNLFRFFQFVTRDSSEPTEQPVIDPSLAAVVVMDAQEQHGQET